ncbi:MAG: sporulation protein Cse60 [Acholeplasmataceae bacterium]|jgi:hypothetical protein|nr:sporulation protein Cse60 [Acholeplasmataceae bacterium]
MKQKGGFFLKVKIFDESHELDLEEAINEFLETIEEKDLIEIRYAVSTMYDFKEQIYCYSALILYRD